MTVTGLAELEARATAALAPGAAEYINRGAGENRTREANRAAWARWSLHPHVLRDVGTLDTATSVLGTPVGSPILVAPTAMQQLAWPDAEEATARGAARARSLMIVSMAASRSVEAVAAAAPNVPRWAQMYLLRDRGRTRALAERARDAGYRAIVASVDGAAVPVDQRSSVPAPPGLPFPNLAPPGAIHADLLAALADFDQTVTPDDLALFREWTGLPVVVKGVLRADDARACVAAGAAGVAVSNHGGRTIDGCVATGDVLHEIAEAVGHVAEVYVDGGLRTGADILRALALGARAVLVGRPVVWGLAIDGEDGVATVLDLLTGELRRAMAFCGAANVAAITRDLIVASRC